MALIPVPKPPKKAFNPRRRPGTLLQNQLVHLEWAVRPAAKRHPEIFKVTPAKTEAEASARIAKLTDLLHRQATAQEPPPPAAKRPRAKSKPRSRTSAKRRKSR
jgi:hypothetical protein